MKKLLIAVAVLAIVGSASANLLQNPGFETANGSDALYWDGSVGGTVLASATWSTTNIAREAWIDGWSGGIHDPGNFIVLQGWMHGSAGIWQRVSGVTGGNDYELTGWFKKEVDVAAGDYLCKVDWYDSGGTIIGGETDYLNISPIDSSTNWQHCTSGTITAPGAAAQAQVVFEAINMSAGGALVADDLSLAAIPEPASAILIGMGCALIAVIRRKRR